MISDCYNLSAGIIFLLDHFSRICYFLQLMFSADVSLMIRLVRKISVLILACLLVLNLAAGAAVVVGHCQSSMGSSNPLDMDHCDGLLNFTFPIQGCCGECNDIFCDLMKTPLQDANAVNTSPFQGSCYPFFLGTVDSIAEYGARIALSEPRYLFSAAPAWSQIPLYIEHLALII